MRKKIRICPVCNREFETKSNNHKYCTKECRKKAYKNYFIEYRKKVYKKKKYPKLVCQYCGNRIQLHFYPLKEYYKLSKVRCYKCHKQPQGKDLTNKI